VLQQTNRCAAGCIFNNWISAHKISSQQHPLLNLHKAAGRQDMMQQRRDFIAREVNNRYGHLRLKPRRLHSEFAAGAFCVKLLNLPPL